MRIEKSDIFKQYEGRIAFRSIAALAGILIIFTVMLGTIGYSVITKALMDQYADGAFKTADTAATLIDPDRIDEIYENGPDTEEYKDLYNRFSSLCNTSGATFIYIIQPDLTDYAHILFILSTANENSEYTTYEFGYLRETTNAEYRVKYSNLYRGVTSRELLIRNKGYIETDPHITAMIPLRGSDGQTKAILCVQRQMDTLNAVRQNYLSKILIVLILLGITVMAIQSLFINKTLLDPLLKITNESLRFAGENSRSSKKLTDTIHNKDEIGLLAASIDQMEEQVEEYVDNLTHITADRERIKTELSLARRIQESMLPNKFPAFPDRSEFDIYASMTPAKEVGGDFYDFFLVDDDHLAVVMADVSGKGIPAALFMMRSMISIRNQTMTGDSPAEVLEKINDQFSEHNEEEMFVTVWLGILEISTGRITAANAGHEYPIVQSAGGQFELLKDTHGFVIGGIPGMKYSEYEIMLDHDSRIFLYTDGLTEAQDEDHKLFGLDRVLEVLNENTDKSPLYQLRVVRKAATEFADAAQQFDDLTMLCLEYK